MLEALVMVWYPSTGGLYIIGTSVDGVSCSVGFPAGFWPFTIAILSISPSLSGVPKASIPLLFRSDCVTV